MTGKNHELEWYFTMCKFFKTDEDIPSKLLVLSNPVSGSFANGKRAGQYCKARKLSIQKLFRFFSAYQKRKRNHCIIWQKGNQQKNISELLFLSAFTVDTHRKNIRKKLEINSLAELIKFAIAFDLISY